MSSVPFVTADLVELPPTVGLPSTTLHNGPWGPEGQSRPTSYASHDRLEVAIVDDRALMRDCFGRSLTIIEPSLALSYYPNVEEFVDAKSEKAASARVVLMCVMWSKSRADFFLSQIAALKAAKPSTSIIILSDIEDLNDVSRAIDSGASGYIPTSVSLEVAVKAVQLVAAGGVYIPANVLFWSNRVIKEISQRTKQQPDNAFTSRQAAVIEALRRGKANKIIAYELNMCESTVKVHIRNIMKKLKAKNRTEVAYILNTTSYGDRSAIAN
ncbi:MAG: response regulator transcription factor [Methylobacterium mesophilicum]|nr:response regulator transcription factor [Methylobacterium mesophilicum]